MRFYTSTSATSLLEVMVAMTIFFLGLVSIYSVVSSTLKLNEYNKNFIIASHLASEQIEIVKNIRDYNFISTRRWDTIGSNNTQAWIPGEYYRLQNTDAATFLNIDLVQLVNFEEGLSEVNGAMEQYRLCIDDNHHYSYDCVWNTPTPFYRYLQVESVVYQDENNMEVSMGNALKFSSRVIWNKSWYHSTQIPLILTNWQRL